jgi:Ran GTPase-activating protein (RanGAP) involved in mRNA processing and transport
VGVQSVCKALLKNNTLESLDLDSNKFTPPAVNLLFETLHHVDSLKEISLRANDLDGSIAPAISKALEVGHLQVLNLRRNRLGDVGVSRIAQALEHCQTLEKLYLSSNRIGNVGCANVCACLAKNTSVKRIGLDMNNIEDDGAKSFADMLKINRTLLHADMSMNEFVGPGCCALADAMQLNPTLIELQLSRSQLSTKEPLNRIGYKIRQNKAAAGVDEDTTGFTPRAGRETPEKTPRSPIVTPGRAPESTKPDSSGTAATGGAGAL